MARKQTKAQQILLEAQARVNVAKDLVANAEGQLGIANAALNAHEHAYRELEKLLAPKQRASPKPREPKKPKGSQPPPLLTNQGAAQGSALES